MNVVIYTRQGCCLCDDAQAILQAHGVEPALIDVDGDDDLVQLHGQCVPVVEIDGKVRFRGRVDPVLLRRLLAQIRDD
ncbi:MAG TPA: glutaredoxin [Lacipirellulaceae bacterium]|nr:glutaredoxin [Lacipirellulaceae bacterium]